MVVIDRFAFLVGYPFSETMSLRAQFTYRLDRVSLLATDPFNASRDDLYMQGIGGTLSWVFDDSRELSLNIRLRYRRFRVSVSSEC